MTRPRPHIPLAVRMQVAARQLFERGTWTPTHVSVMVSSPAPVRARLSFALGLLFGDEKPHLDHNPALILRTFNPRTGKYTPDANDPDFLVYRTVHDHHLKTNVAGDGALRSDTAARMHQRRMDENRGLRKRRPKAKIKSRTSWPKRKFQRQ